MGDYYLAVDRNGQVYIEHGLKERAHKYIMKIGEGAKARYFYTKDQIEAYRNQRRVEQSRKDHLKQLEAHKKKQDTKEISLKDFVTGGEVGRRYRDLEKKASGARKEAEKAERRQIRQQKASEAYQEKVNDIIRDTRENSVNQKLADKWKNNPDYDYDSTLQDWHTERADLYRDQRDKVIDAGGTGEPQKKFQDWHEDQAEKLQRQKEENARTLAENYQKRADKEVQRRLDDSYSYKKANQHMTKASEAAAVAKEKRAEALEYERAAQALIDEYERTSLPGMAQKNIREGTQALSKLLKDLSDIPLSFLNNTTVRVRK